MQKLLLVAFSFFLTVQAAMACGYNFVGGCSSHIKLKINGTEAQFAIDPCNSEPLFHGLDLGNIRSLFLTGGSTITWESCINNVTSGTLYYRVYPVGQPDGTYNVLDLPQDQFTLEGPYTTRYRQANVNTSLTAGLTIGSTYTMEIYVRAEVDTIGDDFIPETIIDKNNSGSNYKLNFTYGGPSAPVLTTVVTRKDEIKCWGQATGVMGVTVYGGDPAGSFFYAWSANTQNFQQIDSLTAGTYTVTITETPSGNTSTRSAIFTQPTTPISLSFSDVTPATCTTPGTATVLPIGGTGALTWVWSNGETTQSTSFNTSGIYALTITDANACTQKGMVTIGGTGSAKIFELHTICEGETFVRGGQSFTQSGLQTVLVPAPNGCDTIVEFYLTVVNGANLLDQVPNSGEVTCAQPILELCAGLCNSTYQWKHNGQEVGTAPCLEVTSGGAYQIILTNTTSGATCLFEKNIAITAHLQPANIQVASVAKELAPCGSGNFEVSLVALGALPATSFTWLYENQVISNNDTCLYQVITPSNSFELRTADVFGCTKDIDNIPLTIVQVGAPSIVTAAQQTLCNGQVKVELLYTGGTGPFTVEWSQGTTGNPIFLVPGLNNVVITDALGCSDNAFVIVEDYNVAGSSTPASNSTTANGTATMLVKGAVNLPYIVEWDNGAIGSTIVGLLPGNYCATITDNTSCKRTACAYVDNATSTTQPFAPKEGLMYWPNPATPGSALFMEALPEDAHFQIWDLAGRLLFEQTIRSGQTRVDLPETLPTGLCFISLRTIKFWRSDKIFLKNTR